MTFEIAASRYWLEVGQHLANSDTCFRDLGWLQGQIDKHTTLDKITDNTVALLVATRRGQNVSNATVNRSAAGPLRGDRGARPSRLEGSCRRRDVAPALA